MSSTPGIPGGFPAPYVLGPAFSSFLICTFISLLLYGVALHQAYRYFRLYSSDRPVIKYYVIVLVVLDALHTALTLHFNYNNLVTKSFSPYRLKDPSWSLNLQPVMTGFIIVVCQAFFARRVYFVDTRYRPLVAVACAMFLTIFSLALAFTVKAFTASGGIDGLNKFSWLQSAAFGVVISADVMLTFVLVLALHQRRTGFKHTNSKIDLLIAYAISTGLVTVIFAVGCFITALASPGDLLFGSLDIICVKVYINSVLTALHTRTPDRSGDYSVEVVDLSALPDSGWAQSIGKPEEKPQWASTSRVQGRGKSSRLQCPGRP